MINTNLKQKPSLLLLASLFISNVAMASPIAFQTPNASWGGWTRGDTNTSYIHWAQIESLEDETPDIGNLGTSFAGLYANNSGAFLTGGGAGGNIYSFSDTPDFTVEFNTNYVAPSSPVTVALQLKIQGTDLDTNLVTLGGEKWDSTQTLFSGSAGGAFGGASKEYLFVWENVASNTDYYLDFLAVGSSLSLDEVSIDIGLSSASPVPLPATAWLFLSALSGLVAVRRNTSLS